MDNSAQSGPIDPRLASIARVVPHQIALVKPSKTQIKVLNQIERGEQVTPEQIANRCDVSTSWTSTLLRRLYEKAYLNRCSESSEKGGITFVYTRL